MKRPLLLIALFSVLGTALCQNTDTTRRTIENEAYKPQEQESKNNHASSESTETFNADIARMKSDILMQGKSVKRNPSNDTANNSFYKEAEGYIGTTLGNNTDTVDFDFETYEFQKQLVTEHYANLDSIEKFSRTISRLESKALMQEKEINDIQTDLITASNYYHKSEVCMGVTIGLSVLSGIFLGIYSAVPNDFLGFFGIASCCAGVGTGISSIVMWCKGNRALKVNLNNPY